MQTITLHIAENAPYGLFDMLGFSDSFWWFRRFTSDTDTLRDLLSQSLSQFISSFVTVVGVFTMMVVVIQLVKTRFGPFLIAKYFDHLLSFYHFLDITIHSADSLDLGTVAAFLQYTRSFSHPITQISQQFNALLNALAGAERTNVIQYCASK